MLTRFVFPNLEYVNVKGKKVKVKFTLNRPGRPKGEEDA